MSDRLPIRYLFPIIILISIVVRIYGITLPVLDHHSIRQVDTASIARNFYENGMNIFYPQFDGGGAHNYVECEFQLYTFTVALLYKMLGVHEILGRILSIALFYLTALYLFKLVSSLYDDVVARYSVALFTILPLSITVSRSFQPENMMLLFTVASLYYCHSWLQTGRTAYQLLTCLFFTLTILTKLPSLYLGLPLAYLVLQSRGIRYFLTKNCLMMVTVPAVLAGAWYYHAHGLFAEYGNTFIGGGNKFSDLELLTDYKFYVQIFINRFGGVDFTPVGYVLLIIGILLPRMNKEQLMIDYWLLSVIVYIFIAGKGNLYHDYYQYPILPVAAVFMGRSLQELSGNISASRIPLLHWITANKKICIAVTVALSLVIVAANIAEKSIKSTGNVSVSDRDIWQVAGLLTLIIAMMLLHAGTSRYCRGSNTVDVIAFTSVITGSIFFIQLNDTYKTDSKMMVLAHTLSSATSRSDIVAITTESSNGQLYYAHRKGWTFFRRLPSLAALKTVQRKGATQFVTDRVDELYTRSDLVNYLSGFDKRYLGNGYVMFSLIGRGGG